MSIHLSWPLGRASVTPIDDMAARRAKRTKWMRLPGETDAAEGIDDPPPVAPTRIRRTDLEIELMTARMQSLAQIGRIPEPDDLRPGVTPLPNPDPFAEGAYAMLRYLRGELDETGLMVNWLNETGATP